MKPNGPPRIYAKSHLEAFFKACTADQELRYRALYEPAFREEELMYLEKEDVLVEKTEQRPRQLGAKSRLPLIEIDVLTHSSDLSRARRALVAGATGRNLPGAAKQKYPHLRSDAKDSACSPIDGACSPRATHGSRADQSFALN